MNATDENSRFTIRDEEEATESLYISDAENLRIEKLSTRITLVAVLIPCLLVIVLTVAYLDIKNRVINTQNTGSMGVQNLSKDLESRFSSLSLKQAKLEEQFGQMTKTLETTTAAIQVKLKKTEAEFKRIADSKPNQSALDKMAQTTTANIASLRKDLEELNAAFGKFDDELAGQILLMAEGLKKDQGRLAELEDRAQGLESTMLTKESMELTWGIERLALQEMVKEKIRVVEKKLAAVDDQLEQLTQRMDKALAKQPSPPSSSAAPPAASPAPAPPSGSKSPATGLVEQTIK